MTLIQFIENKKRLIVISSPSGGGKTTIINHLLSIHLPIELSISATNRPIRNGETYGKEYYFITKKEFKEKIKTNQFVEYEEVYPGYFYGTLASEIETKLQKGKNIILSLDVAGGLSIKEIYKENVLLIFLMPPSIKELQKRLEKRGTDSMKIIKKRLQKAIYEINLSTRYDKIIINKDLEQTKQKSILEIKLFIENRKIDENRNFPRIV